MSFSSLNKEELEKVAEFFVVDVEAADADKGPTKKELLAALASGDEPVTWDQYKDIYLKAVETGNAEPESVDDEEDVVVEAKPDKYADSKRVIIKYDRKNPSYEVLGYTFSKRHPFASVPQEVAEHLVRNVEGFRLALESEVTDYYG